MSNISNKISTKNSTETILLAGETFTGESENVSMFNSIKIFIYSDVNSAPCGFKIYFSSDVSDDYNKIKSYSIFAGESKNLEIPIQNKYVKIVFTNGDIDQTSFSLKVIYNHIKVSETQISFEQTLVDTFNRIRVSQLTTLLDTNNIGGKDTLKMDEYISGTGSITYNTNQSMNTLSVNGVGRATRQTRLYTKYQPGKSFLIFITGILNNNSNDSSVISRLGYFDDNNGLFFEYSNETLYVVNRSYTSGSVVDTKIPQNEWNMDQMNGTGSSGINIDFSKYIIFTINFSWLGAGIIEFGLYYTGTHYLIHKIRNNNIILPYIETPNLPGRFEIISTSGSGSMKEACISINTEANQELIGQNFSVGTSANRSISGTETYIFGIRLKNNARKLVKLQLISLICVSKGNINYKIYYVKAPTSNPITSSNFQSVNTNSVVQYDETGTAVTLTDSILLYQGYFSNVQNMETKYLGNNNDPIYLTAGIDIAGYKSDYIFVTGQNISGTNSEDIRLSTSWIEI
jgi:hypothetical protein